jgi:5-methylcytosine-specific restriction endonuclease McrA
LRPRIIARWGMVCYLCSDPITIGPASSHPLALTIDHVLPTAQGGRDDEENLRPAHRACNSAKGGRAPTPSELERAA